MGDKDQTVAELFAAAGARLRSDFEYHRKTAMHEGEKGLEVEEILRRFLNHHLPRRFATASAHLVDTENARSKQCDVTIYDALNSPVYRASSESLVLPIDHVAAVIEVKTSLNKAELTDAYEKIASCKRLKKTEQTEMDRAATGSPLTTTSTMGIVFGFASDTSIDSLAENARQLNTRYESRLWPDLIVVLDKGVIAYTIQFPGQEGPFAVAMAPASEDFMIPPGWKILSIVRDGDLSLNRFFVMLLSQITFFPHRPSSVPFAQAMGSSRMESQAVQGYQFDTSRTLHPVGAERISPTAQLVVHTDGKPSGQLAYFPWQDGAVLAVRSAFPIEPILGLLLAQKAILVPSGQFKYTSVVKLSEEEFRAWPKKWANLPNLQTNVSLQAQEPA